MVPQTFAKLFNAEAGFATDGRQFDQLVRDGETFALGRLSVSVLHTPGHTPACVTYGVGDAAFVGDTLFMPDYGTARCDFPGGDAARLYRSIRRIPNLPGETRMCLCHAAPCQHTPAIDPDTLFPATMRDLVVWFMSGSDPLYLFGPTGSGKTSLVRQVAARLNYPVFDVTGHGRREFSDLAGHLTVDNGSMRFQHGPLALAMKHGGLFLLNEIDLLDPATAAGLNGVLDGAPLCIPENGGEVIPPHPMFRFVATANTNGGSDGTGLYQGTLRQNLAFMDRFWLCEVAYPDPTAEIQILERRAPALPADFGTLDLPPEKLASLGSKKVCNPEDLRVFATLKARAISLLDRHGMRFLGG